MSIYFRTGKQGLTSPRVIFRFFVEREKKNAEREIEDTKNQVRATKKGQWERQKEKGRGKKKKEKRDGKREKKKEQRDGERKKENERTTKR